ncbi:DNA cytosine methyltransferase [Marinomonas posidonica]|nr:DNA cytosine methyltransferase [Marinomonas posidonica]
MKKNFFEFFAGVGLIREGLSSDNWICSLSSDVSTDKKDTYVKNYGEKDFLLEDIWNISKDISALEGSAFLYTASFPCTDLSISGNRAGLAGIHSGTIKAFFEIIKIKKSKNEEPKVILLENVNGFLNSHNGKDIKHTIEAFSELDYYIDILEIDANFFTAQSRKRIFIIAVEKSLAEKEMKIKNENEEANWWTEFDSNKKIRTAQIKKVILNCPDLKWGIFKINFNNEIHNDLEKYIQKNLPMTSKKWWNQTRKEYLYSQMTRTHKDRLDSLVNAKNLSYSTVFRRMRNGKSTAEIKTDGIAGCLRTPRGGSSKQILIRSGNGSWDVRYLTSREYARLQGLRDSYKLPDIENKALFAMGDAVCVPVISFISKKILTPLYEQWISDNEQSPL